ncbi:DUF6691 family protein [Pseudomonas sp. YH-1]|uniref:DUF6691 family protein n=1 Tax=Pseudomonas sp. YH-1 TaxID=3384787 RepID=UPI003F81E65D
MGKNLIALVCGLAFGLGLLLSGMSDPAKVLGFLDVTGLWSPTLALVMIGALSTATPAYLLARRRNRSLLDTVLQLPTTSGLDRRLLAGSALFGIGWGMVGICPGPALVLLGSGSQQGMLFLLAMLGGMWLFQRWSLRGQVR